MDTSTYLSKAELQLMSGLPKAPMNAYNLFVRDFCGEQKNDFKKASEQYRLLTDEEKSKYVTEAERLKAAYQDAIAKYKLALSPAKLQQFEDANKRKKKADTSDDEKQQVTAAATATTTASAAASKKPTASAAATRKPTKRSSSTKEIETSSATPSTIPTVSIPVAAIVTDAAAPAAKKSKKSKKSSEVVTSTSSIKKEKIIEPERVPS